MNVTRKTFEKACGWTAFFVSYLLVWLVIAVPFSRDGVQSPAEPDVKLAALTKGGEQ